jgi:hypothetical protein
MADPTTIETMTNTTPLSCVEGVCTCDTMWSLAQQFCYVRLSDPIPPTAFRHKLVEDYAVRARRIAATYARFYLEQEASAGSDGSKKGRFYWMALGAFASKTVACTLEAWQVRTQAAVLSTATKEGLGKGNLWLFNDIAGWHFYYSRYESSFGTCRDQRDTSKLVPTVRKQVDKLPWSVEALEKIKNLKVSSHIKLGFDLVKKFEQQPDATKRPALQIKHLLAIADHEQRVILQPLIYDAPDFKRWLGVQRWPVIQQMSPDLELVFSSACSTDRAELKSVAPEGTELEEVESRMQWIKQAANKFHGRMQFFKVRMESELQTIAGWVNLKDD